MSEMRVVLFAVCALGMCLHGTLAGSSMVLPAELARVSTMLRDHFQCTDSCPGMVHVPESLCRQSTCALCIELCSKSLLCYAEDRDDENPCAKYSQNYVCEYRGAVVCNDTNGICIHRNTIRDMSFCVCQKPTGWEPMQQASCAVPSPTPSPTPTPTPPGVAVLVIICCLLVVLTLVMVALVCFVWRTGFFCCRKESRANTSKTEDLEMSGNNPAAESLEQSGSDPVDYSYAYGHHKFAPATDPRHIKDDLDLDEQQEDHYYSRLKKVEDPGNSGNSEVSKNNSGPETGQDPATEKTEDGDGHLYFKLDKMPESGDEQKDIKHSVGSTNPSSETDKAKLSFVEVQPDQNESTGYEIATPQVPDDVKSQSTNHSPDSLQNRDSGYEVANTTANLNPGGDDVIRFTYFKPEQKAGNTTSSDSGYEKVSEVASQRKGGGGAVQTDYDHLKRPDNEVTTASAVKE